MTYDTAILIDPIDSSNYAIAQRSHNSVLLSHAKGDEWVTETKEWGAEMHPNIVEALSSVHPIQGVVVVKADGNQRFNSVAEFLDNLPF